MLLTTRLGLYALKSKPAAPDDAAEFGGSLVKDGAVVAVLWTGMKGHR